MKVLLLTDVFSPCPQSASQRVTSFAQVLSSERIEVYVLASTCCLKTMKRVPLGRGITVYDLKSPRVLLSISSVLINPFVCLLYFFASTFLTIGKKIDVVSASVPNGETAIAGFLLSKLFKIPFIIDVRDRYPPPTEEFPFLDLHIPSLVNEALVMLFQFLYRKSNGILCVSKVHIEELVTAGVQPERIRFLPNGADTTTYKPCSSEARRRIRVKNGLHIEKLIFAYAGSLISYYPVIYAIAGLKKLSRERKNVQLLIISLSAYGAYEKMVEKLGLEDTVRFMGPLSVPVTAEILSACDVGVQIYRGEKFYKGEYGGKIFSYMSCGLPVMASGPRGSVIDKMIQEHRIGVFVGEPNQNNFAEVFSFFVENKGRLRSMGENARKTVEEYYDRRKLGLKLVSLVNELCTDK
jgi:glycosyltransferase involved in cell wall biosynthesis